MELQFAETREEDFDALVELRLEAMRESLEALGRFDRDRSVERFRASFVPADTRRMLYDGNLVGFYSVTTETDHLHLRHLYVKLGHQHRGLGSHAMREIIKRSIETELPIRLGALKGSRSNDFYQRHGFVVTAEDEWDTYYERASSF